MQLPQVRAKAYATNVERYGTPYPMQSPVVRGKAAQTKFVNDTGPSSRPQRWVCAVLGGELNHPVGQLQIDCALVDRRVAVEYDGSGHDASVRFCKVTAEQFAANERRRDRVLHDAGWRLIRLASHRDLVPSEAALRELVARAEAYLDTGHSWVRIDLDAATLTGAALDERLDVATLGLHRVTEEMLEKFKEKSEEV